MLLFLPKRVPSAVPYAPPSAHVPAQDGGQPLSFPPSTAEPARGHLGISWQSTVPHTILHTNNYYNKPPDEKQRLESLLLKANLNFYSSLFGICSIWRFLTLEMPFFLRRSNCPPSCPYLWRSSCAPTALLSVITWTYLLMTVPPQTKVCTLCEGVSTSLAYWPAWLTDQPFHKR